MAAGVAPAAQPHLPVTVQRSAGVAASGATVWRATAATAVPVAPAPPTAMARRPVAPAAPAAWVQSAVAVLPGTVARAGRAAPPPLTATALPWAVGLGTAAPPLTVRAAGV